MKTITLPVYRRPDRLRAALAGLKGNDLSGFTLFVSAEPGFPEVVDLVKSIDFVETRLVVNAERLGLNGNIRSCLYRAMDAGSEFNVAIEEDVVLSPDAFRMARWFEGMNHEAEYASLGFFSYNSIDNSGLVIETQDFRSWGYCFTKASWEKYFVPAIDHRHPIRPEVKHQDMWDFWVQFYFVRYGIKTLHPAMSRSKHIGIGDGTNDLSEINKYFLDTLVSDGRFHGEYTVLKKPPMVWEYARSRSRENLMSETV